MILSTYEIEWVKERIKIYVIKYQEIYDELLDHILTAIEERRVAGKTKGISVLFQDVVDEHFNGYVGIEQLALSEQKIYQKNIRSLFAKRLKQYFNWKMLIITLILLAAAYQLPNLKPVRGTLMTLMFLLAFTPFVYTWAVLRGKIETIKGKRSLLRTYLINQMVVPVMLFQCAFYIPNFIDDIKDRKEFSTLNSIHPMIMMALLMFLLLVNLSYIQSCKEIIAQKLNRF